MQWVRLVKRVTLPTSNIDDTKFMVVTEMRNRWDIVDDFSSNKKYPEMNRFRDIISRKSY